MARGKEIIIYKNRLKSLIINNENIVTAIDAKGITIDNSEDLIDLNVFGYDRVPKAEEEKKTYITITVDIPHIRRYVYKDIYIKIRIITHQDLMDYGNYGNRIDYIGSELDLLLTDSVDFGMGNLKMSANTEGFVSYQHRYRELTFEAHEVNSKKVCWTPNED